ncbi:hypothetical protein E3O19_03375 [Cryobacterium algoritolerans]|uniref:Polysaccharide pyruvyl transferase domain-containing protein n=2 Tax=Cryobacterium algoritolerans TaxID=1259184 RepID=A0A4R8WX61_9MICO|nr:hypothetical protein E3O19_03375 [Cryobacterium algoritolerans]
MARDESSHKMATTIGAASVLSPDMVHSISVRHPDLAAPTRGCEPYFLFQANAQLIARVGEERIARSLAVIAAATKWRPAFFGAGTARHHDRADLYDGITAILRAFAPTVRPMGITTRNPMSLASYIAGSQLWVGSSLHGRIIASSFALPRVSLENLKVASYAATWDPDFPVNVAFDRLAESVAEAVTAAGSANSADVSRHIASVADESTAALVRDFL